MCSTSSSSRNRDRIQNHLKACSCMRNRGGRMMYEIDDWKQKTYQNGFFNTMIIGSQFLFPFAFSLLLFSTMCSILPCLQFIIILLCLCLVCDDVRVCDGLRVRLPIDEWGDEFPIKFLGWFLPFVRRSLEVYYGEWSLLEIVMSSWNGWKSLLWELEIGYVLFWTVTGSCGRWVQFFFQVVGGL